ncbi:class I SAM-dependent methyltransferase [Rickettsiella endosymbiont of Miltochrista miniata]|uniref:class I SAM-dependent methyltransferase n=1 Tax=Rickettsiella endosymbiont of Miltochrista miniata TaxID=3066239 RepID=UPI00313E9B07
MQEKNIDTFKSDVIANGGYQYSNTKRLSSILSSTRTSKVIHQALGDIKGKKIIDIGCGDGIFTEELLALDPEFVTGVDPNDAAIAVAKKNMAHIKNIEFQVMDVYQIPLIKKYDIAIVRGVLHHLYQVEKAIEIICNIANEIIVAEPNGYNPVLKILEKVSPYHIAHEEKSYSPRKIDKWFRNNGGLIIESMYVGFVPLFCPDFLAKILNFFEPYFEKTPLLRNFSCGQYVQKIQIKNLTNS